MEQCQRAHGVNLSSDNLTTEVLFPGKQSFNLTPLPIHLGLCPSLPTSCTEARGFLSTANQMWCWLMFRTEAGEQI